MRDPCISEGIGEDAVEGCSSKHKSRTQKSRMILVLMLSAIISDPENENTHQGQGRIDLSCMNSESRTRKEGKKRPLVVQSPFRMRLDKLLVKAKLGYYNK